MEIETYTNLTTPYPCAPFTICTVLCHLCRLMLQSHRGKEWLERHQNYYTVSLCNELATSLLLKWLLRVSCRLQSNSGNGEDDDMATR